MKLPSNAVPPAESWLFYRDWVLPVSEEVSRVSNSALFSGWCSAPAIRPMVITTIEKPSDPSAWKPFGVPVEYRERLLEPFRLAVGRVNLLNCNTSGGSEPQPFSVRVEDLRIFKGYASRSKEELISIGLDPSTYRYDGPAGTTWARHWFLLTDNVVDYVGNSMELVDSGDFDADGKSEVLFWHSEYNQDGYVLYFDDMRRRVDYTWGYH